MQSDQIRESEDSPRDYWNKNQLETEALFEFAQLHNIPLIRTDFHSPESLS
jgi:hypothetical protein